MKFRVGSHNWELIFEYECTKDDVLYCVKCKRECLYGRECMSDLRRFLSNRGDACQVGSRICTHQSSVTPLNLISTNAQSAMDPKGQVQNANPGRDGEILRATSTTEME